MPNNPYPSTSENQSRNQESNESIDIVKLIYLFISKWYWFVASIFVALIISIFYIKISPKMYTRSESILFVENQQDDQSKINDQLSDYISIGTLQGTNNIHDKILTLQDPIIMQEVVRHLGLDITYTLEEVFKDRVLYGRSPITLSLLDKSQILPIKISVKILEKNEFQICKIEKYDIDSKNYITLDKIYRGKFNDTIETTVGPISIKKTFFLNETYNKEIIKVSFYPIEMISNIYSRNLDIQKIGKEANVIVIKMTDTSIIRADAILKTLINVYNSNWLKDKNQIAVSTSEFINTRLAIIEKELSSVDHDINEFKSINKVSDIKEAGKEHMRQTNESEEHIFELENQLSLAGYVRTSLNVLENDYRLLPVNIGLENGEIDKQITTYNHLLIKRNNLLSNSSEKNPLILQINQNLNALRKNIEQNIDKLVQCTKLLIAKEKSNSLQKDKDLTSNNPEKVSFLLSAERRQKVKETLYLFLLQKREENELSQIFVAYSTKVINPPHGSSNPVSPKKKIIYLIALFLGLGIPAVLIYIKDLYDTDINSREDIKQLTIPFIGELPQMKGIKTPNKNSRTANPIALIAVKDGLNDLLNEAFRSLRTNLNFMSKNSDKGNIVMITSMYPGSGKTFISMNLALTMALCNVKSLVISADLRRGSLSKYVGNPKDKGLSLLLHNDKARIEDNIIKGTLHPKVDVIPTGTIPPNPAELLMKPKLKEILDEARKNYDYIFIDCPPIDMVTDTLIISKQVDITLFIVRSKIIDKRNLPYIENLYRENRYPNMALILNGVIEYNSKYVYNKYYSRYSKYTRYYKKNEDDKS